jgi:hypothetical protein
MKIPQREMARFRGDTARSRAFQFSPDDQFLFVGVSPHIAVYRVNDGSLVRWRQLPRGKEWDAGMIHVLRLIEGGKKVISQHWDPHRFAVWDVDRLVQGGDTKPFLLFPKGDPDHKKTHRFEVFGSWDAGRLVVLEHYDPSPPAEPWGDDPGPRVSRLRLRRWQQCEWEPEGDFDLLDFDRIWVGRDRADDGWPVVTASQRVAAWRRLTVRWESGRASVDGPHASAAGKAFDSILAPAVDYEQLRCLLDYGGPGLRPPWRHAFNGAFQHSHPGWVIDPSAKLVALPSAMELPALRPQSWFVRLIDLESNRSVAMLPVGRGLFLSAMAFSHNGRMLASSTELDRRHRDGSRLLLWHLPSSPGAY